MASTVPKRWWTQSPIQWQRQAVGHETEYSGLFTGDGYESIQLCSYFITSSWTGPLLSRPKLSHIYWTILALLKLLRNCRRPPEIKKLAPRVWKSEQFTEFVSIMITCYTPYFCLISPISWRAICNWLRPTRTPSSWLCIADFSMASTDAFLRLTLLLYCSTYHEKCQGMSCDHHSIITGHTSLPTDWNNDLGFVKSAIYPCALVSCTVPKYAAKKYLQKQKETMNISQIVTAALQFYISQNFHFCKITSFSIFSWSSVRRLLPS